MIGYVTIGTKDIDRACAFYEALLAVIGARQLMGMDRIKFFGTGMDTPMLAVCLPYDGKPHQVGNGNMVAIPAARAQGWTSSTPKRWNSAPRRGRTRRADAGFLWSLRPRSRRQQALLLRHANAVIVP